MRYLVIASCEDVRTGKEFEAGDEFLPEPDIDQAKRLKNAGCLREIPDDAPTLPGSDDSARTIADLRATIGENATKAEGEFSALNARLIDLTGKHDALVEENTTMRGLLDGASGEVDKIRGERDALASDNSALLDEKKTLTSRVAELERLLEAATKPVDGASDQTAPETAPVKTPKRT